MNAYATDTNFLYKNVITENFVAKASMVSGQDLEWFFDEWVNAPNHPIYENTVGFVNLDGNWKVNLTINQIQTNTMFFKMPVQIGIDFIDGTDTLIQVINDSNPQYFEFFVAKQPISLAFDPQRNILLKQATTIVGINDHYAYLQNDRLQADPNPFASQLRLTYDVKSTGNVKISILDINGKILKTLIDRKQDIGLYQFTLCEDNTLSPGVYSILFENGNSLETKTIIKL